MVGDERVLHDNADTGLDRIVHIPLSRWDVDIAGQLAGDSMTLPIEVSGRNYFIIHQNNPKP